ncbi:MAG: hypothetical protein V4674_01270 [Patescibacteria group bacterium]
MDRYETRRLAITGPTSETKDKLYKAIKDRYGSEVHCVPAVGGALLQLGLPNPEHETGNTKTELDRDLHIAIFAVSYNLDRATVNYVYNKGGVRLIVHERGLPDVFGFCQAFHQHSFAGEVSRGEFKTLSEIQGRYHTVIFVPGPDKTVEGRLRLIWLGHKRLLTPREDQDPLAFGLSAVDECFRENPPLPKEPRYEEAPEEEASAAPAT